MNEVIIKITDKGSYTNDDSIEKTLTYIYRYSSDNWKRCYGIYPLTCENAIAEFHKVRSIMPNIIDRRVWHLIISFPDNIKDSNRILHLADQIGYLLAHEYQVCYAMHRRDSHKHIHFIISTTSYIPDNSPLDCAKLHQYLHAIEELLIQQNFTFRRIGYLK